MLVSLIGFVVCAAFIIFSGTRLSRHGDRIAELTGWGKAWTGLIIMASVTSLPELMTGISAVAIVKAPDLAAGDIFGSCVFNLLILSVLDALVKRPLLGTVRDSHIVAGTFGIILMAVSGAAIVLAPQTPVLEWVSFFTPVLMGIYLLAIRLIFLYEQEHPLPAMAQEIHIGEARGKALRQAVFQYGLNALVVIMAAIFLPYFGNDIARQAGMENTFFGTVFIAAATSLPELVVSISGVRMGAVDMAVGNLLGSNIFNIFILGLDDIFYRQGSLFAAISPSHLLSLLATIVMTAVAALGVMLKPTRKVWLLGMDTLVIALIYVGLMVLLFFSK